MANTRGSYPHPVLGDADDVSSTFEIVNFTVTPAVDDIQIRFDLRMNDPDIQALLDSNRARYSYRWTCSSTITSRELNPRETARRADSTTFEGWIDQQDVRRDVRLEARIVATAEIADFDLANKHADYGSATFHLQIGDVLGYVGPFEFSTNKLFDPLSPPIGSLFRFVRAPNQHRRLKLDLTSDDDHILVLFPSELLDGFGALERSPHLQVGLVVFPALMQVITAISESEASDSEDLSDRQWFQPIRKILEQHGYPDEPAFDIAQGVLGNPFDTSLTSAFDTEETE
jgi:hypothetical protein